MKTTFKSVGLCLALLALLLAGPGCRSMTATPTTTEPKLLKLSGSLGVHDPAIIKEKNTYYIFCTGGWGGIIPIRCSTNLLDWKRCGSVFDRLPAWVADEVPLARGVWAPDISWFNGKYHLYYALSSFGVNKSAIGLAVNETLDPASPRYKWVDEGLVVRSRPKVDDFNAIDPTLVIEDKRNVWLAWGSFWGGIKMCRINPATGKPSAMDTNIYSLATRPRLHEHKTPPVEGAIEAPTIIKHGNDWYLFASYDFCCRGTNSTYNVKVGRSKKVTGPYVDRAGKLLTEDGGTELIPAVAPDWVGAGHQAVFTDGGQDYIVFHAYDRQSGQSRLQISTLVWEDGWPRAYRSSAAGTETVSTEQFADDAAAFIRREITAHVAAVESIDPPQPLMLGVPTKGDFTWGSFMRAISDCTALTGQTNIAGHNVPEFLGKLGLIESRQGGKTFSQLGAALTLRHFGSDLATNALWQSLSPSEQNEWRALLDPGRFYDFKTHHVIGLPENYMGVAARIATYDYLLGITPDRATADEILTQSAGQFLRGAPYTDDNLPTGRYDRYSQEYARFTFDTARNLDRKDVQAAVEPALKTVMQTWWGLAGSDGYGYPWGRTIGDISYMDTMEIVGFLAAHPEFRPAPLRDLASEYFAAWRSLQRDYETNRHLLNMFGFGRGNYHYMTVERQWQQTTSFLGKSADSLQRLLAALRAENITDFPVTPQLPEVARFDFFRTGDRSAGVWLVRQGPLRFALPISTGIRPGIDDYLPAPHGLPGFAAPVEQLVPALVPHLELEDGRLIVASDGADEIIPGKDGKSLRAIWRRYAEINAITGNTTNADLDFGVPEKFVEAGLTTEVVWKIEGSTLMRTETISADRPVKIRRFAVSFPSTARTMATRYEHGQRTDQLTGVDAILEVSATSPNISFTTSAQTTGNSALGKGTRGPVPLILNYEAQDLTVKPKHPLSWIISIKAAAR